MTTSAEQRISSPAVNRTRRARGRGGEDGWALLTILLFAAVFIIGLATALPIAAFETHRQHEQDLMDRGKDYMRGIQLYYRKFRRYPNRLEDLENTNQIRFLRKRWKDPMTGSDEWRLIHMTPAGILVDSVLTAPATANGQVGQPGGPSAFGQFSSQTGQPGGFGQTGQPGGFGQTGQIGQPGMPGQPTDPSQSPSFSAFSSLGGTVPGTSSGYSGGFPGSPGVPGAPGSPGAPGGTGQPAASFMTSAGTAGTTTGFSGQPTVIGAGIAGVASKSDKASIMTYNQRQKYNEWEFIYDPRKDPLMMAQGAAVRGQPGQPGQPGPGQPGQPSQPGAFGTQGAPGTPGFGPTSGFGGNPPGSTVGVPNMPPTTIPHP